MHSASQIEQATSANNLRPSADLLGSASNLVELAALSAAGTEPTAPGPEDAHPKLTKPFDAIVAIGVLIKGETMHFEYIAASVSDGLMRAQDHMGTPVVFGVLTVLNEQQGLVRAGLQSGGENLGREWGRAAVEMGSKRRAWGEGQFVP